MFSQESIILFIQLPQNPAETIFLLQENKISLHILFNNVVPKVKKHFT